MQPGFDRSGRNALGAGDLNRGLSQVVHSYQNGSMLGAQRPQRIGDHPLVHGGPEQIGCVALGEVVGLQLALVARAAPVVDHQVPGHGVQPGPDRLLGAGREQGAVLPEPQQRLLHDILGELSITAGQAKHIAKYGRPVRVMDLAQEFGLCRFAARVLARGVGHAERYLDRCLVLSGVGHGAGDRAP